jgi:hypothetical protein
MSCERTGNRRSQTTAREAGNRPAVISVPPSSPKPAGERAGRYARGVQLHHGCAPFRLHRIRWASVKAQAHMSCNRHDGYCVQRNRTATCANATSSRLRNQCRDLRQPCCRRFDPWGSLDRRVNCRRVPQPRWVGARRSAKGENQRETGVKGKPATFVFVPRPGRVRLQ